MKKLFICAAAVLGLAAAAAPLSAFGADAAAAATGWQTDEKGRIFYYGEDGEPAVGTQTIDGVPYYFADNGVLKTGWRTVEGKRRYYDHKTGKPIYGWIDYCGSKYYVSPEEGKQTGSIDAEDGGKVLLGEYGYIVEESGFAEVNNSFYYVGDDGKLLVEPTEIAGVVYNISEDGVIGIGWQEIDGKRFYFSPETGKALLGKCKIGDNWYYISDKDGMATGDKKIGSVYYRFGNDGVIRTGWQTIEGEKHYFYEDTSVPNGIAVIDGERYIFSNEGVMRTGRVIYDNKKYYLGDDGVIKTGMHDVDGSIFLFGEDGVMLTGWQEYDGKKRYFDEKNGMLTGRVIIGGFKYALDKDGVPLTGPVRFEDGDYLFGADGKMLFGWQTISGNKYYFDPSSGRMQKNTVVDGIWLNQNGVADPSGNKKQINVKNILQNPELPTGCESVSLTILLNHFGYTVDKLTLVRNYLPKMDFYWSGGIYYGADFRTTFAGDPESANSYGCYAPCITTTANKYFAANGYSAKANDLTGADFDSLLTDYIYNDIPVLIWITSSNLHETMLTSIWTTPAGEKVQWLAYEHCVVLTGYDRNNGLISVSDPLIGNTTYDYSRIRQRYIDLGQQAVSIV